MILDDKIIMFPPPPPYLQYPSSPSTQSMYHRHHPKPTLTSLPPHILLQIIHHTFPPTALTPKNQLYQDTMPEKQRKTLFWLSTSLRLVSRQLYTACMHVLRSTYLPSYQSLIRSPYTSDPFPLSLPASSIPSPSPPNPTQTVPSSPTLTLSPPPPPPGPPAYSRSTSSLSTITPTSPSPPDLSPLLTIHRETPILDRFIALKVRQDVFADDTELHTDREDAFRDLFDVAQPRARLEDLVRVYGVREGVVSVPGWEPQPQPQQQPPPPTPTSTRPTTIAPTPTPTTTTSLYANPTPSSSSLGSESIPPTSPLALTPTRSSINKSSYTYTLDPSINPSSAPSLPLSSSTPSSSSSSTPKPSTGASTPIPPPHQRTRRSFFSLGFIKSSASSSSSSSKSPLSSPSPSPPTSTPLKHPSPQPTPQPKPKITPLPFTSLSISFSPRRVGLLLNRSRTIVTVPRNVGVGRARGEPLEVLARALVEELKVVLAQ